ncbi:MAG: carboxypeptidase regulatory-like domain-containing protein [Bacteroidia bacterium]|nr:carboxypeptidase regulatory-like domain-containing protein [Bacteroidia bacterium]
MKRLISILLGLSWLLFACNQEPGIGGSSTIIGKIFLEVYNSDFSLLKDSYYLPDEYVYIIDGDNVTYRERVKTNFDGTFEFPNLKKGHYTIFAYSMDSTRTLPGYNLAVIREVDIDGNRQLVDLGDLTLQNNAGNKGTSRIRGKVYEINYNSSFTTILDEYYVPDFDVYIIYDNSVIYDDKVKTSFDGAYEFRDLPKGDYTLFVYSDDSTGQSPTGKITLTKEVTITENGQTIALPDFVVLN